MEKECIKFGLDQVGTHTPLIIKRVGTALAAFLTTIATTSFMTGHSTAAFILMTVSTGINQLIIPLWGIQKECINEDGSDTTVKDSNSVDKEI